MKKTSKRKCIEEGPDFAEKYGSWLLALSIVVIFVWSYLHA